MSKVHEKTIVPYNINWRVFNQDGSVNRPKKINKVSADIYQDYDPKQRKSKEDDYWRCLMTGGSLLNGGHYSYHDDRPDTRKEAETIMICD